MDLSLVKIIRDRREVKKREFFDDNKRMIFFAPKI